LTSTTQYDYEEYKQCAGKDCTNHGVNRLEVLYIKKVGWFCDQCRSYLVSHGIAFDSPNPLVTLDELVHGKDSQENIASSKPTNAETNKNSRFAVSQKQLGGDLKQ